MAAVFIDLEAPEIQDTQDLPKDAHESTPEELVESLEAYQPAPEADDVPEKYRGKSIKDIVAMHQEAEKLIGKHSGEVGELRQFVDGFIKGKLAETTAQQHTKEPEEEVDFFEDPQRAVSKAIESHPAVQAAAQQANQYKQQTAVSMLQQKHPDLKDVLGNPQFIEWVKVSPIRRELFQRADQAYDVDCADELVTLYKERLSANVQTVKVETEARKQQVKAAQTGSASGASAAGGNNRRIYRRTDIIKLMKNDPSRYEALSDEIMEAYREGRVR